MLVPAILYKDELTKKFSEYLYTEDYYLYVGYPGEHTLPDFSVCNDIYRYAIIDNSRLKEGEVVTNITSFDKEGYYCHNNLIGYLSYRIDRVTNSATSFGLFSFDRGNIVVGKDLFNKMEELVKTCHRIEWRMIGNNPVKNSYDKFCKKYNGNCVCLHDVTKDLQGNYRDEYIYEIINNEV